jgi:hypothetical protein
MARHTGRRASRTEFSPSVRCARARGSTT